MSNKLTITPINVSIATIDIPGWIDWSIDIDSPYFNSVTCKTKNNIPIIILNSIQHNIEHFANHSDIDPRHLFIHYLDGFDLINQWLVPDSAPKDIKSWLSQFRNIVKRIFKMVNVINKEPHPYDKKLFVDEDELYRSPELVHPDCVPSDFNRLTYLSLFDLWLSLRLCAPLIWRLNDIIEACDIPASINIRTCLWSIIKDNPFVKHASPSTIFDLVDDNDILSDLHDIACNYLTTDFIYRDKDEVSWILAYRQIQERLYVTK